MPTTRIGSRVLELFGHSTGASSRAWASRVQAQQCPFLDRRCLKNRKSTPEISIGSCTVAHGKDLRPVIICPHRFLERRQVFLDCIHLLRHHQPGNELRVVPEVGIPGGTVDYFLVSARKGVISDFVGIELQTLDTTGTVWPERQRFLASVGLPVPAKDVASTSGFGMNWKMTAKTILVQLHHKLETFEHLGKKLALVLQDELLTYMRREFSFGHLSAPPSNTDPMQFHGYALESVDGAYRIELRDRASTDVEGIAIALGLQAQARVELDVIVRQLTAKLPQSVLLTV